MSPMREVTKKLTGVFLFCVMTMVVALETPALKYCLCMESFIMMDCACEREPEEAVEEPTCGSNCCATAEPASEAICKTHGEKQGCTLSFTMDLGDYHQGAGFEFSAVSPVAMLPPVDYVLVESFVSEQVTHIRGSPEPPPLVSVPLYVRHSVFLL